MSPTNTDQYNHNLILKQIISLKNMNISELKQKWEDLHGTTPPQYKKPFLVQKLAYRIQELAYGGLSIGIKKQLQDIAQNDPIAQVQERLTDQPKVKKKLISGTRLVRIWKGKKHEVTTNQDGFEYQGMTYKSLSAVARTITGTRWNGRLFFGVQEKKTKGSMKNV